MAIEKIVDVIVKEQGFDSAINKSKELQSSVSSLSGEQKNLAKSMGSSAQSVLDNGGAMGLLNDATGGYAMTIKDAVEASWLFTKSEKAKAIAIQFSNLAIGKSTGLLKAFRLALIGTGIGALIVSIGLLIANFDKVKNAIFNLIPGLKSIGNLFKGLVNAVTDFIGVTSEASRELDRLTAKAEKSLKNNEYLLDVNANKYDQYTQRKIKANIDYNKKVVELNNDETLSEQEKLKRIKAYREKANTEILKADSERQAELDKKRQEESDKIKEQQKAQSDNNKRIADDRKKILQEEQKKKEEAIQKEIDDENKRKEAILSIQNEYAKKLEDLEADTELKKIELEEKRALEELDRLKATKEQKMELTQYYDELEKDTILKAKEEELRVINENKEKEKAIEEERAKFKEETYRTNFGNLQNILSIGGKNMQKISKALAIVDVVRTASKSVSESVASIGVANAKSIAASPLTGGLPFTAFNTIQGALQIGSTIASATKSIQAIASESKSVDGGGGAVSGGGGSVPQAPSFNLVQGTGTNQIAESLARDKQPLKAYVVASEVSTQQALDRNIESNATI